MADVCRLLREAILDEVGAQTMYQQIRAGIEEQVRSQGERQLAVDLVENVRADEQRHGQLFRRLYALYCRDREGSEGRG